MRIAAGVLLLIVGLWSVGEGGCSTTRAVLAQNMEGVSTAFLEAAEQMGDSTARQTRAEAANARQMASARMIHGVVMLIAGALSIIAGVLFFVNRGRAIGFLAPGVGVIGEVLFFALESFAILGVVKMLVYAFSMFAATRIGGDPDPRG